MNELLVSSVIRDEEWYPRSVVVVVVVVIVYKIIVKRKRIDMRGDLFISLNMAFLI